MNKMTKSVKAQITKAKLRTVTNYMGGESFELNPLDTLKIVTASSIFGEPQYYRHGQFADKYSPVDGLYRTHSLISNYSILPKEFDNKKTSDIMEETIDAALDYDYAATLEWARTLRKEWNMRLNPQIIMVRAATHPGRKEFTEANPGLFGDINNDVMSRLDEPASQLTYWLFKNKTKNNIPSVLKRSWERKINKASRYQLAKYKNANVGLIDVVRVSHAKGPIVDELMKTGTIQLQDNESTWERLKSDGKSWKEILNTIDIPHMALLRNLRGIFTEIKDVAVCKAVVEKLKAGVLGGKQFPFRYQSAIRAVESADVNHKVMLMDALEECMDIARENLPKLEGRTMCLSDNSGSAWGAVTSEYGTSVVAEIDNLSSIMTAQNSDEGYIGLFGDKLTTLPVSKRNGTLFQAKQANEAGRRVGMRTENGIWLFFEKAIKDKEHWDNIFIYSDQQAGHGRLYGIEQDAIKYRKLGFAVENYGTPFINVPALIEEYRRKVNPKVNVFTVQTAGYNNVVVPENMYRTSVLYGWTGKEIVYAKAMIDFWNEKESQK